MKDVYTYADLSTWTRHTLALEKKPILAVIGDPVEHSKSPQMHQPALDACGIDGLYIRLHLKPEEVEDAIARLPDLGFVGINCTIPHKLAALEAPTHPDPLAVKMKAANTLLFRDGEIHAWNTDGPGFRNAIREEFRMDLKDLRIALFGAGGGAGRAVAVQFAAEGCERLVLVNRTVEKAEALAEDLRPLFKSDRLEGPVDRLSVCAWEEEALQPELDQCDLLVNATSLGMHRSDPEVVPANLIQPHHLIYDMVYSGGETRLLEAARLARARAANGQSMLLHQGAISFEYWFDQKPPLDAMRQGLSG